MKDLYPGYYSLSEDDFKDVWERCLFVFDASALLSLYSFTESTSREILAIIASLSKRVWIPNQSALEYQANRRGTIRQQVKIRESLKKEFKELLENFEKKVKQNIPPFGDPDRILAPMRKAEMEVTSAIESLGSAFPYSIEGDPVLEKLESVLEGRVGDPFTSDVLLDVYRRGEIRFAEGIPPGFRDKDKDKNKYGDLIVWLQCIEKAKSDRVPIVLVTEDTKEDWWEKGTDGTEGPRRELRQEFFQETGECFYAYRFRQFLKHAEKRFGLEVSEQQKRELNIIDTREEQRKASRVAASSVAEIIGKLRLSQPSWQEMITMAQISALMAQMDKDALLEALEFQLKREALKRTVTESDEDTEAREEEHPKEEGPSPETEGQVEPDNERPTGDDSDDKA